MLEDRSPSGDERVAEPDRGAAVPSQSRTATQSPSVVPDDAQVPALLLQPLLENAIYHGIESQTGGGSIKISGMLEGKQIVFTLSNSLPQNQSQQRHQGNKIAQDNVRERLNALYAHRGKLEISETDDTYQVSLQFPYERPGQVENHEDFDR